MTTLLIFALTLYAACMSVYARALYRSRRRLRRALDYERQTVTRLISTPEPAPPDVGEIVAEAEAFYDTLYSTLK